MPNSQATFPHFGPVEALRMINRQREPANLEFPFAELSQFITPCDQFYVRSHFSTPTIDPATWRLSVEGCVDRPMRLSLDELMALGAETRLATLECAGNGRLYLRPKAAGVQWDLGAVSTAQWTGLPLANLLDRAGVRADAAEVVFQGADTGMPDELPKPPGNIPYARSIPLAKIPDVLLAYRMNDQPLPTAHGAPLRAVVGGWYGMASVKWLSRIILTDRPFLGYFQTTDYAYWSDQAGLPVRRPIGQMMPKAQIARPATGEQIARGSSYRIVGAAWTGDADIVKVEISTDGGKTFSPATLLGEPIRHAWRFWEFLWHAPAHPGPATLLARATDSTNQTQPAERDPRYGTYVIEHMLPVEISVI